MLQAILIVTLLLCCFGVLCADAAPLKAGDAAPDAGAVDETGKVVKLSSFKGKSGIVIFFFPKADTPG
jgi:hypothetical protein